MNDWGRLVVPVFIAATLTALRLLGVFDDTELGFSISAVFVLGTLAAFMSIIWRSLFPRWVLPAGLVTCAVIAVVAGLPLVGTVFPGEAEFSITVRNGDENIPLDASLSGHHRVEVYASSLAHTHNQRGAEGKYELEVDKTRITGTFSDTKRRVRSGRRGSRNVEQKHLMDLHPVVLGTGDGTIRLVRLDSSIGPELRISVFPVYVAPFILYLLLGLAIAFAVALDSRFQEQTERWRLGPWMGMIAAFLVIFESSYARDSVTNTAIWSSIFGGAIGFTGAWLVGLMTRKLYRVAKTKL